MDRAASPQVAPRAPEVWTSGLVTLALCLYRIDARQFWRDEQATWWVVQLSDAAFRQMLQGVDAVMAPYYLLERAIVTLWGDSPFVMRLPSALAMGTAGAFMAAVAGRLVAASGVKSGRERTFFAWFSGLAFATIPSTSYYGQEARGYAFALASVLAATWLLLFAMEAPERTARWFAYAIGVVAIGLTHLVYLCILPVHALLLLRLRTDSRSTWRARVEVRRWPCAVLAALVALAPFVSICAGQAGQVSWIRARWKSLWELPMMLFHQTLLGWLFVGTSVVALVVLRKTRDRALAPLGVWAFGAPLVLFATRQYHHLFLHRYMLFTVPAMCMLTARLVLWCSERLRVSSSRPWLVPACALLLLCIVGAPGHAAVRAPVSWNRADYAGAVAFILRHQQPGDGVVFGADRTFYSRFAFAYFTRHQATAPRDLFAGSERPPPQFYPTEGCPETEPCVSDEVSRVWVLATARDVESAERMLGSRAPALLRAFTVEGRWSFKDVNLALLKRRATPLGI